MKACDEDCAALFGRETTGEQIARWVDSVRLEAGSGDSLVALLSEQLPFYQGKSSNEVAHIRGYIMAAFEKIGLPPDGVPLVLEELESGHLAYGVGAAAIALRGLAFSSPQVVPYLFQAIENIRYSDDFVCFDKFLRRQPARRSKTALQEVFRTFAWQGAHAANALPELDRLYTDPCVVFSGRVRAELKAAIEIIRATQDSEAASSSAPNCCLLPLLPSRWMNFLLPKRAGRTGDLGQLLLEDQDGNHLSFADFFHAKPAIVVFFYTRCDNPRKCSLTITKLALLQKAIQSRGLARRMKTAAFTYDPLYDSASRLKIYGSDRGVRFDEDNRLFRTPTGVECLQQHFDLGVGFLNSIVNRHRIELYLLDENGRARASISRLHWDIDAVLDRASELLASSETEEDMTASARNGFRSGPVLHTSGRALFSSIPALLLAIAPKCPICWAAWFGALGIVGWKPFAGLRWLIPILVGILVVQTFGVYVRTRANGRRAALVLVLGGFLLLFIASASGAAANASLFGVAVLTTGFFMSSLPGHVDGRHTEQRRRPPG